MFATNQKDSDMASNEDGEFIHMSTATADMFNARRMVVRIEDTEAERRNETVNKVRPAVARRLRAAPGTLENIRRYRSKVIPSWLMDRIRAEFVALLMTEIQGLEHEVQIARQIGSNRRDDTLAAAEAQLAAARQVLDGEG